ncbi:hypothetical protein [Halolamina rubra]|uniref:hypothetical protein n=1 Tax=Halolamina rubra TaxID=1380430 RepID=UPI000678E646|nr:hypothetical protein [Halolamina rubra]
MLRKLYSVICAAELLAPRRLIDAAERVALEDPAVSERRSWVVPGARLEGLLFLVMLWRSDRSYSRFKKLLGAAGLIVLLRPRAYVDYGTKASYRDASTVEWRPWVYTGARLVGLLYVLIGLRELGRS